MLALVAAASLAATATFAAPATPARRAPAARPAAPRAAAPRTAALPAASGAPTVAKLAGQARVLEDAGDYVQAIATLRALRGRVPADGDLELSLAIDAVRGGLPDTARALLYGARLSAALADSTNPARWRPVGQGREHTWLDGTFSGWHWTVARARAELALRQRRWDDAFAAAKVAVSARPLSGRDHLLLALAAGRTGDDATSRREAEAAAYLDPTLPEAIYLRGLWEWRDGHRAAAREDFRAAIALDPASRPPALALVRIELPGAKPDSLPGAFLTGARRAAMLTATEGPKLEAAPANDQIPGLYGGLPTLALPDSIRARMAVDKPVLLEVTVLVSETGRALAVEFPYLSPAHYPAWLVNQIGLLALRWKFQPAVHLDHPVPMWINVEITLNP
jgi:tetratricopeptide (TPR) repeat protein